MERGTENIYCEDLQVYFTKNTESFVYASSTQGTKGSSACALDLKVST